MQTRRLSRDILGVLGTRGLTLPVLDDAALRTSYAYDLDTVPTVILADETGTEPRRVIGFGRQDWPDLFAELSRRTGIDAPHLDWAAYPDSRPGCGSRSVEPGIAERLAAQARGDPLRARRIDDIRRSDTESVRPHRRARRQRTMLPRPPLCQPRVQPSVSSLLGGLASGATPLGIAEDSWIA